MGQVRLKHVVLFLLLSHQFIMTSAVVTNNRLLLAVGLATGAILSSYSKSHVISFFHFKSMFFYDKPRKKLFFLIYIYRCASNKFCKKSVSYKFNELFRLSFENTVHCHTAIYALLTNINI